MSFAQIHRMLTASRLNDEREWRRTRLVAYEMFRHGSKNAPDIETYLPIGETSGKEMTKEDLDEIWDKYGKLN